jgi:hypothetical protein
MNSLFLIGIELQAELRVFVGQHIQQSKPDVSICEPRASKKFYILLSFFKYIRKLLCSIYLIKISTHIEF